MNNQNQSDILSRIYFICTAPCNSSPFTFSLIVNKYTQILECQAVDDQIIEGPVIYSGSYQGKKQKIELQMINIDTREKWIYTTTLSKTEAFLFKVNFTSTSETEKGKGKKKEQQSSSLTLPEELTIYVNYFKKNDKTNLVRNTMLIEQFLEKAGSDLHYFECYMLLCTYYKDILSPEQAKIIFDNFSVSKIHKRLDFTLSISKELIQSYEKDHKCNFTTKSPKYKKLFSAFLYYNFHFNRNEFCDYFDQLNLYKDTIKILYDFQNAFSDLSKEEIIHLCQRVLESNGKIALISKVLCLAKNYQVLIDFFQDTENNTPILANFPNEILEINFVPEQKQDDDLDKINFLYILLNEKNARLDLKSIFKKYKKHYETTRDLDNIFKIQETVTNIIKLNPNDEQNKLTKDIEDIINIYYNAGIAKIKEEQIIDNSTIIKFINIINEHEKPINTKDKSSILSKINFDELTEIQFTTLCSLSINDIIGKIESWKHCEILMNFNQFTVLIDENDCIVTFIDKIKTIWNSSINRPNMDLFDKIWELIITISTKDSRNHQEEYFKFLCKVLDIIDVIQFICPILSKFETKIKFLELFINELSSQCIKDNSFYKNIIYMLPDDLNLKLIQKNCLPIINLLDFFSFEDKTNSKKILISLYQKKKQYFSSPVFQKCNFMIKTKDFLNNIIKRINNNELMMNEIQNIININENHKGNLELPYETILREFLVSEEHSRVKENLYTMSRNVKEISTLLQSAIKYYQFFEKNNSTKINEVDLINNSRKTLNYILFIKTHDNTLENLKKSRETFELFNKLTDSKYFVLIYNNNKQNKELAKTKYDTLKVCLEQNGVLSIEPELLKLITNNITNYESIVDETNMLKTIYKLNIADSKKHDVAEDLFLLSQDKILMQGLNNMCLYITKSNGIVLNTTHTITQYIKDTKINQLEKLKQIKALLFRLQLKEENKRSLYPFILLRKFLKEETFLEFMWNLTDEQVRESIEFVDALDPESQVKPSHILDLNNLHNFTTLLNKKGEEDQVILTNFFEKSQDKEYENIERFLDSILSVYDPIRQLYNKNIDKNKFFSMKMKRISLNSYFVLKPNNKGMYDLEIYENRKEYESNQAFIKYDDLIEIKDRALLHIKNNDVALDLEDYYSNFPSMIEKLLDVQKILNDLSIKGYSKNDTFIFKVDKFKLYQVIENEVSKVLIKEVSLQLEETLHNLINVQIDAYKKKYLLTFIYGRRFLEIIKLIRKESDLQKTDQNHFIRCLTNNQIQQFQPMKIINQNEDCSEMINNLDDYLNYNLQSLGIEKIYERNIIHKGSLCGLYIYYTSDLPEKELISIYYYYCRKLPCPFNVLVCSSITTVEEIIAFLYRVITCKQNVLFAILNPERLLLGFGDIIYKTLNNNNEINCALFIFYIERSLQLITNIINAKINKHFERPAEINEEQFQAKITNEFNISLYPSLHCGIGRSVFIKDLASNSSSKQNYIYFPLGGDFTRENLIYRLKQLNIKKDELNIFHLDLADTNKQHEMEEFLFEFLVMKCYYINENIFFLQKNVEIHIESPYGFYSYEAKFKLLKNISHVSFTSDIVILNAPPDIQHYTQIVSNYLTNENELNKKNYSYDIPKETDKQKDIDNHYKNNFGQIFKSKRYDTLIREYIENENFNLYQIKMFVDAFGSQLKLLTECSYLQADYLLDIGAKKNQKRLYEIRTFVVNSFANVSKRIARGIYTHVLQRNIENNSQLDKVKDNEINETATEILQLSNESSQKKEVNILPETLIFFNEDKMSFSIIKSENETIENIKLLTQLWNAGQQPTQIGNIFRPWKFNEAPLVDYKALDSEEFLLQVKKVFNIQPPIDIKNLVDDYSFTYDNFAKMIMILIKLRAEIPVILMGETGCGKTYLIETLAKLINREKDPNNFITLNVHAGICDADIIEFMNNIINKDKEKDKKIKLKKKLIFFDEINTCNSMGLITEMMTKKTMQGKSIPSNYLFLSACNPYKKIKEDSKENEIGLKKLNENAKKLVYAVNPLPHTLLNYVTDFGRVQDEDEIKYMKNMLQDSYKIIGVGDNVYKLDDIIKLISISHKFLRNRKGDASVSLREIRRFAVLMEWYYNYIKHKKGNQFTVKLYQDLTNKDIQEHAILMTCFFCYYLRLTSEQLKSDYLNEIHNNTLFKKNKFEKVTEQEENDFFDRLKCYIPKGIGRNTAILQNLLTAFVCINTKIPLFICGKPGCSKTLSVQILFKAMKGKQSTDIFFKDYPRLYMNSYQGSMTSTSKGVENIFDKANNVLKIISSDEKKEDFISMVYFDEMGLAERSSNNPLKVLHSKFDKNCTSKDKQNMIAFIGISNWTLDAAKMNRGLYLAIPDPDEKDLKITALSIAEAYDENVDPGHKIIYNNLSQAYYKFKEHIKIQNENKKDYYGTRDFYFLIKCLAQKFFALSHSEKSEIAQKLIIDLCIERNFGGDNELLSSFKKQYQNIDQSYSYINEYNVTKCIENNLKDKTGRYLLIITSNTQGPFIINLLLTSHNIHKALFFIGSQFDKDKIEEKYPAKIINKIQTSMEQGDIIVLKNLEAVYPSLYDLFNQSYSSTAIGKKFCRIALGTTNNSYAEVHENFKCLVLVDQSEIKNQDPPFLNRFEKHQFSIANILADKYVIISQKIRGMLIELSDTNNPKAEWNIKLKEQMINFCKEEIQGIIFKEINKKEEEDEEDDEKNEIEEEEHFKRLITAYLEKIVPTFSQDLIAFMQESIFASKYPDYVDLIMSIYEKFEHRNIKSLIKIIKNKKNVVYTFSNINDYIDYEPSGDLKIYNMQNVKTEEEIEKVLNDFYDHPTETVFLIKLNKNTSIHLLHLYNIIERIDANIEESKKKVIILSIHLTRIDIPKAMQDENLIWKEDLKRKDKEKDPEILCISFLSKYDQVFIDNLNGPDIFITQLLNKRNIQLFQLQNLFNKDNGFKKILYSCFSKINFEFLDETDDNYIAKETKSILDSQTLKEKIYNIIVSKINMADNSIMKSLFDDHKFKEDDCEIISIIQQKQLEFFEVTLHKLLFKLESDNVLNPFISGGDNEDNQMILNDYLNKFCFNNFMILRNSVKVRNFKICCIQAILEKIKSKVNSIKEYYFMNDNKLRIIEKDKNSKTSVEERIENYYTEEEKIVNNLYFDLINDIQPNAQLQLLIDKYELNHTLSLQTNDSLYNDYYKFFIADKLKKEDLEVEQLMILLVELQFTGNAYSNPFLQWIRVIIWIESNSSLIKTLIQMFIDLKKYRKNLLEDIKTVIEGEIIEYEVSQRSPKYLQKVNGSFYLVMESILYCSLSQVDEFLQLDNTQFNAYINILKSITEEVTHKEAEYQLTLKNKIFVKYIVELNNCLTKANKSIRDHLKIVLSFLNEENEVNKNQSTENLCSHLDKEFKYLVSILNDSSSKGDFLISFLIGKYLKYYNSDYRKKILTILFIYDSLIEKSYLLIKHYLKLSFQEDPFTQLSINPYLMEFNNTLNKSGMLQQVLLYYFQTQFNNYIIQLREQDPIEQENHIKKIITFIKSSIQKIENHLSQNKENNIELFFCMSLIKVFCRAYIENKIYHSQIETLFQKTQTNLFNKLLKVYCLKLYYEKSNNNFHDFLENGKKNICWFNEFTFNAQSDCLFDHFFLSLENYEQYSSIEIELKNAIECNYTNGREKEISDLLQSNLLIFFNVEVNLILSNLNTKEFLSSDKYKDFSKFMCGIIPKTNLNKETKELLQLVYQKTQFIAYMTGKDNTDFELALYCYKFCLMCTNADKKSFYFQAFSQNCKNIISNSYIPGIFPKEDRMIDGYFEMKNFFEKNNHPDNAMYCCSCGYCYSINPCGLPKEESNCPCCCDKIGGTNHKLVPRDGHFRVYPNESHKKNVENRSGYVIGYGYVPFDSMLLKDFYENKVRPKIDIEIQGIIQCSYPFFQDSTLLIRGMSQITFRILNLILNSLLYYAEVMEFIAHKDIQLVFNKLSFDLIKENWKILSMQLKMKNIKNIYLFIQMIYPKLFEKITKSSAMKTSQERQSFEIEIEVMINTCIKDYPEYEKNFIAKNREKKKFIPLSMESIIQEQSDVFKTEEIGYPLYRYFLIEHYPNPDELFKQIEEKNTVYKYPIIQNYYLQKGNIKKLQSIHQLNPFINYMINHYSYILTRDEAKEIKNIKDELNENNISLFKEFTKGWETIASVAVQYRCRPQMPVKPTITEDDLLCFCLNDDGDLLNGMYIASAYQKYIEYQNTFINTIIEANKQSGFSHCFVESLSKEINAQDANVKEVVSFSINNNSYSSIEDLVSTNTNCNFLEKSKLNTYTYNFDLIEEELGKIFLPGKRLFSENQKFITYQYEAYHGEKSTVIEDFNKRYKPIPFENNHTEILNEFVKKQQTNIVKTLSSIQLLIYYLKNEPEKTETSISNILIKIPEYINIEPVCRKLFEDNKSFVIGNLYEIYEVIEILSYNYIKENVNVDYMTELDNHEKNQIIKYFKENRENKCFILEVVIKALKKFVARFLSGKRSDNQYSPDNELKAYLLEKPELWPVSYNEEDDMYSFQYESSKFFEEFTSLKVCHTIKFIKCLNSLFNN